MSERDFTRAQERMLKRFGVAAEARFVEVPAIRGRAHVLVSGDGPPVVLVNGIGTPAAMWAPLMARLDGFKLYGVDRPGFGLTDPTPRLTEDLRANAVSFLEQVLDRLGLKRPFFVANSEGSLWTLWLALDRPQRVAAMVHVGCPALILNTSAPLPMRLLSLPPVGRLMMRLQPPSPKQVQQLSKMVRQHPLPPDLAELLLATERLPGFKETFLATLNTLLRLRGARPEMALTADQLAQIRQPVKLIWGADDPFGSCAVGERAAEIITDAVFHVVPGGHVPWINEPERVGQLAKSFLERHRMAATA
jgi:2-hydroxy-6-oxonona-2,4-dienedioate hydrolase